MYTLTRMQTALNAENHGRGVTLERSVAISLNDGSCGLFPHLNGLILQSHLLRQRY